MKVNGTCKKCKNEVGYSTNANTRIEFAMQEGETITLNCEKCRSKKPFHVDELYAKESKIAQIGAGLIFLVGTPLIFLFVNPVFSGSRSNYVIYAVGGFILIPVIIYGYMNQQDRIRVNSFNRGKLKGRIHNIG